MTQIYIDKKKYFTIMRRPSPNGKTNIFIWKTVMRVVALIGVITNAYILSYGYSAWFLSEDDTEKLLLLFAFLVGAIILWKLLE